MIRHLLQTAKHSLRPAIALLLLAMTAVAGVSCTSSGKPAVPSQTAAQSSPSPSDKASELLAQAAEAAGNIKNYAFELDLSQQMTGEQAESNSTVAVSMQGHAELGPLKLDQTIRSDIDGESYTLRAILVPGAYYMYEPEFEDWSKATQAQIAELSGTLSDFQVDPAGALRSVQALDGGLHAEQLGANDIIRYEGNGAEASAFLETLLKSTLDLSGMDPKVRESIKVGSLKVELTLHAGDHLPVSYRIESEMTVEYVAGQISTLKQTFAGNYGKINAAGAVVVPDEAKNAPDPEDLLGEE